MLSAADVKKLREKTGCGMMDCKKALTHSNGDMDKAIDYLREKGLAAALKKSGRIASEGIAFSTSTPSGGVIIEVNSETDFVAKNEEFKNFVSYCASLILEKRPSSLDELMDTSVDGKKLSDLVSEKVLKIGENIKIRRFDFFDGITSSYVHAGGKIAVLTKFDADKDVYENPKFQEMAKDVSMQIAAANPLYLNRDNVPSDVLEHERKILLEQALSQGKPENIAQRMVEGRINKYYQENCLLDQVFVKDSSLSVSKYVEQVAKSIDKSISISKFIRYERGEGLEKKSENFADEVSKILK